MVLIASTLILNGCGKKAAEGLYTVSYLDTDQNRIVKSGYTPADLNRTPKELADELLKVMSSDSGDVDLIRAIPDGVTVTETTLDEAGVLRIDFGGAYSVMAPVREILLRLALVQTLTQVDGVNAIEIYVDGALLKDAKGNMVTAMTNDDFVVNPGEQINSINNATITLYFADATGTHLIPETQNVFYNSNVSLEKLVLEHLIAGPKGENAFSSLPKVMSIMNISVTDKVCYVNFDEGFMVQDYNILEPVVIYSVVNSLCELSNIDKVQISVNGNTDLVYRNNLSLNTVYEPDSSLISYFTNDNSVVVDDTSEESKSNN